MGMEDEQNAVAVVWSQSWGKDPHNWSANLGRIYKLRVFPEIKGDAIVYCAQVSNIALDEIAAETDLSGTEAAKRRAVELAWDHNLKVYHALYAAMEDEQKPPTEDEEAFGVGAWVYCRQHMRAHQTGWCGVSPRDKVGLGVKTAQEAIDRCRAWGFPLYSDLQKT
jgi:hypothetical protein